MTAELWRPLIGQCVSRVWPTLPDGSAWIEAQVAQESDGEQDAISPVGAKGLLQLMPTTAAEMGVMDSFDPRQNLEAGVGYLRKQYEHLSEIRGHSDRLAWAFASYNAGRGFVNKALSLARNDRQENWMEWETGRWYLMHHACQDLEGRRPIYQETWNYVAGIRRRRLALMVGHA